MRVVRFLAAVALLAACQSHAKPHAAGSPNPSPSPNPTGCAGIRGCPFGRPMTYVNATATIDGMRATFRPVTRVTLQQTHRVVVTVHFLRHDAPVTSWKLGEGNGNFLKGMPLLARGTTLADGQVITVMWKPRLTGQRSLTLDYQSGGGESAGSALDVQVYGGTTLRVTDDCTHQAVRPPTITVAGGDGAERLEGVRYDTWDRTAAYGTATVVANDFTPDRAHGHDHRYPAHIRLSGVREFPEGPRYTVLRITFDGPTPYGQRVETTLV